MKRTISCFCILLIALSFISINTYAIKEPDIQASAAILYEKTTDSILYERNADQKQYPASLTKIMTAIIAIENCDLNSTFTATRKAIEPLGSDVYLKIGEEMLLKDLLDYLLVRSGNDAANVIAYNVAGDIESFVEMMNQKAKDLGCTNTHFVNPHGLHDENHYTSARDILLISLYAMKNETFSEIVAKTSITLPTTNKHSKPTLLYSTNHLLSNKSQPGYVYDGAIGIKTGHTTPAGYCLSAACEKNGMTLYSVVMGCEKIIDAKLELGNFIDTIKLFEYGANNFSMKTMLKATEPIVEIPVEFSPNGTSVILLPEKSISAMLPNNFSFEDLIITYNVPESVEAPIEKGQAIGTMTIQYNETVYETMNLLAGSSLSRSETLKTINNLQTFIESTTFKIIIIAIIVVIVALTIFLIIDSHNRRKRRKRNKSNRYYR